VLRAPIKDDDFGWFKQYIFPSNIWMLKAQPNGRYMYQELLEICKEMSADVVSSMDSIYAHLTLHSKWDKVMAIDNDTRVARQDDAKVGLLQDKGLARIFEMKSDEDDDDIAKRKNMQNFIDSNMAINILTATASKINEEFQHHMRLLMSSHGTFKAAPMKKVERSISKLENDYKNEAFPKSAKLLDLVRCSVTFNTVEQLCAGYEALVNHATANGGIIELARVKNGFLDKDYDGGYRDIKVNVIYKSQNPEHQNVNMICEVQLLLINYLEEKKKIHKLYSILREEIFFNMVVRQHTAEKDVKKLQLTQKLTVGTQVKFEKLTNSKRMYKSSVDSEFKLLAMECRDWFGVVDMENNTPVLEMNREWDTYQSHHWITIQEQKYLCLQTKYDTIVMLQVKKQKEKAGYSAWFTAKKEKAKKYEFVQDDNYTITVDGKINFCEFDATFEHILLVIDETELQIRSMQDVTTVSKSVMLEEKIRNSTLRNLRVSADGTLCVLGSGHDTNTIKSGQDKTYFYVIDIANEKQYKLTSEYLASTYAPCFINGENQFAAVGDQEGKIEIWDIEKQQSVQTLQTEKQHLITSAASSHDILAIGSNDQTLRLYDTKKWECFYEKRFDCDGASLHLTEDLKYVTFAGEGADRCVVLQIE